jgi:hypothetical protein
MHGVAQGLGGKVRDGPGSRDGGRRGERRGTKGDQRPEGAAAGE